MEGYKDLELNVPTPAWALSTQSLGLRLGFPGHTFSSDAITETYSRVGAVMSPSHTLCFYNSEF